MPLDSTTAINFDGLTTARFLSIDDDYSGFKWSGFNVIQRRYYAESGYNYGATSGRYVAFYTAGDSSIRSGSISSAVPFSVAGFHATAAWSTGVIVLVEAFDDNGSPMGSHQTTLGDPQNGPIFIDLRGESFQGLYELKISSYSGNSMGLRGDGPYLAIDDLLVY